MYDGKVAVYDTSTLAEKAVLAKSGANTFAINGSLGYDCIAIACGKKVFLHFFNMKSLKFEALNLGKSGHEVSCNDQVVKMGTEYIFVITSDSLE